jgi:hypothetical protein
MPAQTTDKPKNRTPTTIGIMYCLILVLIIKTYIDY